MEQQPPQPHGGAPRPEANSYGTDDPATQTRIEQARAAASEERRRDRARLERYVEAGLTPDDAEALIEFEHAHEQQQPSGGEPTEVATAEELPRYQPRVYVADLASLEQGIRHGLWVDADQHADDLDADIAAMLESSPTAGAAVWAIYGAEGFAGINVKGMTDSKLIAALGRGVAQHGEAFAAYVEWVGTNDAEALEQFLDHYMGTYASLKEFGRSAAEDLEWPKQIEERLDSDLAQYVRIEYAAWGRDAAQWWHVVTGDEGIHVFAP